MSEQTVGLVIVSHSEKIAVGVVELAGQMAAGTRIVAAGGTDDGRVGTSFDKVGLAIAEADSGGGAVVLCDLGSAILTAETALDFLDDDVRERVLIADAPIVEGAVAAAVAAETGGDLRAVLDAAESAGMSRAASSGERSPAAGPPTPGPAATDEGAEPSVGTASGSATLVNKDGLHARPAAEFVRTASAYDARVTVNDVDAKSLLRIMSLGLTAGSEVVIKGEGPDAEAAVRDLVRLIETGFGE